jgi:hypothetical protein
VKWQLLGDWPVNGGLRLLPAGTILGDGGIPPPTTPLPINAIALDTDGALAMAMAYEEHATINGWHQLHFDPSVDREAVLAQARHLKRWPTGQPSPLNKRSTLSSSQ